MKPGIECVVIAVDEPQLDRCLHAVHAQERPFDRVRLINNVVPASEAFNRAIADVQYQRVMMVGGDMILYPHAATTALQFTGDPTGIYSWCFSLLDTFLQRRICCVKIYPGEIVVRYPQQDVLRCDLVAAANARHDGLVERLLLEMEFGTHFDQPDKEQAFRRFYVRGQKPGAGWYRTLLRKMLKRTGLDIYKVALEGLEEGFSGERLGCSPNIYRMKEIACGGR